MIITDTVLVDYLTVTTYDETTYDEVWGIICWLADGIRTDEREGKLHRYSGNFVYTPDGMFFRGVGRQKGLPHYMICSSGYASYKLFARLKMHIAVAGTVRVRRIDLQVTKEYKKDSTDFLFSSYTAVRKKYPTTKFQESQSKCKQFRLGTAYRGSRFSEVYYRCYEKAGLGDELFLRFEVQYNKLKAESVGMAAAKDWQKAIEQLRLSLDRFGSDSIKLAMVDIFDGTTGRNIRVVRPKPNRQKWMQETVFPALWHDIYDHGKESGYLEAEIKKMYDEIIKKEEN